jgi:FlaA1/EpsC-like NDP-sugar epimerase
MFNLKNIDIIGSKTKRCCLLLISDIFIITFSFYLSFLLRFGFIFKEEYQKRLLIWLVAVLLLKIFFLAKFKLYHINWNFFSLMELLNIIRVGIGLTVFIYTVNLILRQFVSGYDLPKGMIIIDALFSFSMLAFIRIGKRIFLVMTRRDRVGKKVMIIGANYTTERIIKELLFDTNTSLYPAAVIDQYENQAGTRIHGVPVFGGFNKIAQCLEEFEIETVLMNLPDASHRTINSLFSIIKHAGIMDIKVVPKIDMYESDIVKLKDFKQLAIEDLLSREAVKIEFLKIQTYLKSKAVLVSGAPGSIGREIVNQLIQFNIKRIIALDIDETEIFNLENELKEYIRQDQEIIYIVADIRDKQNLDRIFRTYRPQIVFHAAAYKHVPLMERFPYEAVKTNVFGTQNMVRAAVKYKCEKFVNISTDKAVNPSSMMGASKRLAEIICNMENSAVTRIVSVRFGNVLGSRGSVIPIFMDQIKKGGPITVTHPDMQRYFMSIPEAVSLVLQASLMGQGGEVFVLDMGEPVRILDLAETLIKLHNLEPTIDIDIVFSGLRPGEKLFEELLTAEEGTELTYHQKIFVARNSSHLPKKKLDDVLLQLKNSAAAPELIRRILKANTPFYSDHKIHPN